MRPPSGSHIAGQQQGRRVPGVQAEQDVRQFDERQHGVDVPRRLCDRTGLVDVGGLHPDQQIGFHLQRRAGSVGNDGAIIQQHVLEQHANQGAVHAEAFLNPPICQADFVTGWLMAGGGPGSGPAGLGETGLIYGVDEPVVAIAEQAAAFIDLHVMGGETGQGAIRACR